VCLRYLLCIQLIVNHDITSLCKYRYARSTFRLYKRRNDRFAENKEGFTSYLLRERGIGPLRVWSGVLGRLLLRIVGVIGPGLGAVRTAVSRAVDILVGVSFGRAWPRRIFLVSRAVTYALETGGIPNWRRRWWRCFVSLIKRKREAVESEVLAVSNETNDMETSRLKWPVHVAHSR